jgi:hypothetical protein
VAKISPGGIAGGDQWGLGMPLQWVGWQPSRFLSDRGEAEHAFQLAEQLGSVNAAAAELGTTWPSLRKAFARHGLGMPARNPRPSGSGRSRPPASAAASRPRRPWTRCLRRSTLALFRPGSGRRPSCTSGSAATRSTPFWAPAWWSSCTAKATPAGQPPAPGRSSAAPERAHRHTSDRHDRSERRQADRTSRTDRSHQARAQVQEREVIADAR